MKGNINNQIRGFFGRLIILISLIFLAIIFHRVFSYFNMAKTGAIIFILVFSGGVMYYYFRLFHSKSKYRFETIIIVFFILILTILMYALIYFEPIGNSQDYFLELGNQTQLSFSEALYFSVNTITTLGYGDISPVGFYRYLTMLEVIMGWIYSGSLIYFIVREIEVDERDKK